MWWCGSIYQFKAHKSSCPAVFWKWFVAPVLGALFDAGPGTLTKIVSDMCPGDAVQGAELIDSVLDVVRKEAESCDCLQGEPRPPLCSPYWHPHS